MALAYSEANSTLSGYCSFSSRQQSLRKHSLMFAARRKGEDDFGEWLRLAAVFGGLATCSMPSFLFPVNPTKPERSGNQRSAIR